MLITNSTLITFDQKNQVIHDGAILITGEHIADLGSTAELTAKYPNEEILDAQGKVTMPGLICAHTHFYGAFARGMAIPGEAPQNFPEILEKLWWQLDKALLWQDIRYSALVCLVDAIRHGTTALIDHHASPSAIEGSLDIIAQAVEEAGVRACLCYEVTDRDGEEKAREGIRENERFIRRVQGSRDKGLGTRDKGLGTRDADPLSLVPCPSSLVSATMGLHASLTLSDETLERAVGVANELGVGFHVHVAEDMADQRDSLKRSGLRVVERLNKLGVLGPQTIAAHCVHVDAYEMDILRDTGTRVVHNPRSNMNNAVGTADVPGMLKRGIAVGLGNDGFSNNMFTEMHAAYLVHKLSQGDPRVMGADQVMQMAFQNNAQIAALFWPSPPPLHPPSPSPKLGEGEGGAGGRRRGLGQLSVGALADIILVDYVPITPLTQGNFPWHIIFGVDGTGVDTTIVGGRVLMRNKELLTLDEKEVCAKSRELAGKLWKRV
ncbi:MAG: putative aminohydrolase SsnA [Chloroflexi bacterium]|nr:putative aminohydrolase SsnA [Chloroflexota bacterium]